MTLSSFKDTQINASEYKRDNQKWTIQRNWQHRLHKTKKKKKKTHTVLRGFMLCMTSMYNCCPDSLFKINFKLFRVIKYYDLKH